MFIFLKLPTVMLENMIIYPLFENQLAFFLICVYKMGSHQA